MVLGLCPRIWFLICLLFRFSLYSLFFVSFHSVSFLYVQFSSVSLCLCVSVSLFSCCFSPSVLVWCHFSPEKVKLNVLIVSTCVNCLNIPSYLVCTFTLLVFLCVFPCCSLVRVGFLFLWFLDYDLHLCWDFYKPNKWFVFIFNELYSCMLHLDSHISHFASCQKGVYLKDASGSDIKKSIGCQGFVEKVECGWTTLHGKFNFLNLLFVCFLQFTWKNINTYISRYILYWGNSQHNTHSA